MVAELPGSIAPRFDQFATVAFALATRTHAEGIQIKLRGFRFSGDRIVGITRLLGSSVAEEMRKEAEAKEAALNAAWTEFISIPERAERINDRLNAIANELASLDITKIEADFRQLYRATLNGAVGDPFAQMQLAGLSITAPLRKGVLTQLATELETGLAELKTRLKVLAKKLGQKSPL